MGKNTWTTQGFEGFSKGTFGNGGQNIYVSKKGILQRIFQYDLNHDGYIDLVYANCQNHHEAAPSYVYTLDGERTELPGQGSVSGMVYDIDGDGYQEIFVAGHYDMAAWRASTDIYYGTKDGYGENYRTRIPTPWTADCCHGDFKGTGSQIAVFAMENSYKKLRLFEKTGLNCYEWNKFTDIDLDFEPKLCCAGDLDGDGFDDLIVRGDKATETLIFWGGEDGLSLERTSVLPEFPASEILDPEEEKKLQSEMEKVNIAKRRLQSVRWNGRDCFTVSTGKKLYFFSATRFRQLEAVLEIDVPFAAAVAVGDLDGDGFDDIAIASSDKSEKNPDYQQSFIIWNGPDGLDKKPRTKIETRSACDVTILGNRVLFAQEGADNLYTNYALLFTYPDFENPQKFEGENMRRGFLFQNPGEEVKVVLINHYARSSIGFEESYVYWGSKDGYSEDNVLKLPCHCAVDSVIADFNDDGWAEIILANNSENSMHLDVGHHVHYFGPDGFEPEKSFTIKTDIGWGVCAGDFDHDGYLEIATPGKMWSEMRIYSARDNFQTYQTIEFPEDVSLTMRWPIAVDLNGDGWLDLFIPCGRWEWKTNPSILWGGPEGFSYERRQELSVYQPIGASAADLTKNGYPDLIIGSHTVLNREFDMPHSSSVTIYWNGPEGISESRKCVLRGDAADHMVVADFNGDGWLDVFAGSYHGGKDRDINSFLYWNREGKFRELDRDLLFTHSASGCLAADFNEDGYIDLAVANHKVDGDHHGYSTVWWNGEDGFDPKNVTNLPTNGPHGMVSTEIGNILDRGFSEYYYSEEYKIEEDCKIVKAEAIGDVPEKTAVNLTFSVNGGEWTEGKDLTLKKGDVLKYRAELYAYNGLRTPRIEKIVVNFE